MEAEDRIEEFEQFIDGVSGLSCAFVKLMSTNSPQQKHSPKGH